MPAQNPSRKQSILELLERKFPDRAAITRPEFRALLGLSMSSDARLKRDGCYPPLLYFPLPETSRQDAKILLTELAEWLAGIQDGGHSYPPSSIRPKKRDGPWGAGTGSRKRWSLNSLPFQCSGRET